MNIQEAIEILSNFSKQVKAKADGAYEYTGFIEAKKMAIAALQEKAERGKAVSYKFLGEGGFQSSGMEEPAEVCVVQCMRCGWRFFGDAWWESGYGNEGKSEQIPQYCPHCGRKLGDEVER